MTETADFAENLLNFHQIAQWNTMAHGGCRGHSRNDYRFGY